MEKTKWRTALVEILSTRLETERLIYDLLMAADVVNGKVIELELHTVFVKERHSGRP